MHCISIKPSFKKRHGGNQQSRGYSKCPLSSRPTLQGNATVSKAVIYCYFTQECTYISVWENKHTPIFFVTGQLRKA